MSRPKNPEQAQEPQVQEESPFPEGYIMNQWDGMSNPEKELAVSRGRPHHQEQVHEGTFYMRPDWKIPGYQLGWIMERLLNEPQDANLEKAHHRGWRPVTRDECWWLSGEDYPAYLSVGHGDNIVRKTGMMLMKMPQEMFDKMTLARQQEGLEVQRQSNALTEYMSNNTGPVQRMVVENNSSYTPNYKHR